MTELIIIGGGLAGSEAAWQAAERGLDVRLYEMRPRVPESIRIIKSAQPAVSLSLQARLPRIRKLYPDAGDQPRLPRNLLDGDLIIHAPVDQGLRKARFQADDTLKRAVAEENRIRLCGVWRHRS